MRDLVTLGVWVLGWIGSARALFVWESRQPRDQDEPPVDGFFATIVGLMWPVVLGLVVVLAPIVAVGWLISRPVRRS